MKNMMQNNQTANVESLTTQAFNVCKETIAMLPMIPETEYFFETAKNYYAPESLKMVKPKVIVFGTDFPTEIVYALTGRMPYWIIGGNHAFNAASDEEVPRDTDPVTRSMLRQLLLMEQAKESALVILPCASDAQRKVAYLLQKQGWKVVTVWIPAVKDPATHKGFLSEMEHTIRTICRHVGKRYSAFALDRAVEYMNVVRSEIHTFLEAAAQNEEKFPENVRMTVLDTFYYISDLKEWCENLKRLTAVLKEEEKLEKPRVLLIGSPIFFPNFKIPSLLAAANVEICGNIDSRSGQYEDFAEYQKVKGIAAVAHDYFEHNSSSAFVWNDELMNAIRHYVKERKPDGIIWHVLKGQIEYDFELNRCEKYFEEMDLPVIRLETDYQYQDVEQLRIRIEAFGELLSQKKNEKTGGFKV